MINSTDFILGIIKCSEFNEKYQRPLSLPKNSTARTLLKGNNNRGI